LINCTRYHRGTNKIINIPNLSVIMPCYNHSRFLCESIEGVLGQTYDNLELIIVDDFSDDNSVEIIEKYKNIDSRIKFIYHSSNMGVSKSRNDAISLSTGKYIAFCDADDIWERNKIEVQLEALEQQADYDVVYCDSIIITEDSIPTGDRFSDIHNNRKPNGNIFNELCLNNFINTPTVIFRRICINNCMYFNEEYKYLEDWIYWLELASEFKFRYIDEPLVRYRVHNRSTNMDGHGYKMHRIKAYKYIAAKYPNLMGNVLSKIYYNIGVNYIDLGEIDDGITYFIEALRKNIFNYKSIVRLILIYLKK